MEKLLKMKLASLLLFLSFNLQAAWDIRGHQRVIGSTHYGAVKGYEDSPYFSQALLNNRIIGIYSKNEHTFEIAYELFTSYNRYEVSLLQSDLEYQRFNYRLTDFDYYLLQHKLLDPDSYSVIHNLDRFFYQYSQEKYDLKVGRQAVTFGSARTVNPLDVLVPFDLVMINMEQRNGVDAFRGRYSFSEMGVMELGTVLEDKTQGIDQFRFISIGDSFINESVDIKLLYATLKQNLIRGVDIQASVFGWGTWLEYGFFTTRENIEFKRYSFGGQYHFQNDVDFYFEYHFNEAGTTKSDEYTLTRNKSYNKELAIYLFGKEYINIGGSYLLTPLRSVGLSLMNNISDGSILIAPSYDYNFKEDWFFQVGGFFGYGESGLNGTSEFGKYPKSLFITLKNFF
jgi:hypothetical protein